MSASAVKKNYEQKKKIIFKSNKKLNYVLIQNDEILVIFQYLQEKLLRFRDYTLQLHIAQATEKIFGCCSN